ncbi:MAG: Hsp33 family molecular chaperone HslO [Pseudanabaenaceae cyanobacterium bins.68]|nr:Hsp33 family molecular chaperone HslO [Pseudanabaenaceae cyanobacterium bins.68]
MADQLIRATAVTGGIRAVGVITTATSREAAHRHQMSPIAAITLGRAMAASLLLASNMKQRQARVNLRFAGNGPIGTVFADAGQDGTVRGYVTHPGLAYVGEGGTSQAVAAVVGKNGFLDVMKDVGYDTPYTSTVELVSGDISDDVAHFLFSSEQTPSALLLGESYDQTGVVVSGGLLLQILPKAARDESLLALLESRVASLQALPELLAGGKTLEQIMESLLGDLGLIIMPVERQVKFECRCSRQRMLGAIKILGEAEIEDMIATDHGAEATCHFCSAVYRATEADLHQLLAEMRQEAVA